MSCFTETRVLATSALDPTKHVNFVRGMVLGEDEFKQEFAWLSGRDQWLARDLIGYGTVRGLKVQVEQDGSKGPRIYVHPGVALTPVGQLVCVPSPQCANLNEWLKKNAAEVQPAVASPPQNPLALYVVLCYRECPTDKVSIPGEPCRSEDQLVQPSRLRDEFALEISLKRPAHHEERALRKFCARLREVDMTDDTVPSPPLAVFLDWVRNLDGAPDSPPASPPGGLRVHPGDAAAYLRAAFHLWTTELRPKWFARWYGCAPGKEGPAPLEDCVLLAELEVPLVFNAGEGAYQVVDTQVPTVFDGDRPYVLHSRMLQEWLIGGASALPTGAGSADAATSVSPETSFGLAPLVGISSNYARADHTHGTPTLPPVPNPAVTVVPETTFGLAPASGGSTNYAREDHTHGTPDLPALGGDASGTIPNTTVNRVRGIDVVTTGGANGNVLMFVSASNSWQPRSVPTQFVQRATAQPYLLVAAGRVNFAVQPAMDGITPILVAGSVYNGFRVIGSYGTPRGGFQFTFNRGADDADAHIVKLTPIAPKDSGARRPFAAYLSGFFPAAGPIPAGFSVSIGVDPAVAPGTLTGGLMIEVSRVG